jgi:hypothetical protein
MKNELGYFKNSEIIYEYVSPLPLSLTRYSHLVPHGAGRRVLIVEILLLQFTSAGQTLFISLNNCNKHVYICMNFEIFVNWGQKFNN